MNISIGHLLLQVFGSLLQLLLPLPLLLLPLLLEVFLLLNVPISLCPWNCRAYQLLISHLGMGADIYIFSPYFQTQVFFVVFYGCGCFRILFCFFSPLQVFQGLLDEEFILHGHFIDVHALWDVFNRIILGSPELFWFSFGWCIIFIFQIFSHFLTRWCSMILVVPARWPFCF